MWVSRDQFWCKLNKISNLATPNSRLPSRHFRQTGVWPGSRHHLSRIRAHTLIVRRHQPIRGGQGRGEPIRGEYCDWRFFVIYHPGVIQKKDAAAGRLISWLQTMFPINGYLITFIPDGQDTLNHRSSQSQGSSILRVRLSLCLRKPSLTPR